MRLHLEHDFDCSADRYWEVAEGGEIEDELAAAGGATHEELDRRSDERETYVRKRITAKRDIPAAMKKVLGTDSISYEMEVWRDKATNKGRWKITPMVLQGRFEGGGTVEFRERPGGVTRVISGDLSVKVPLIGKKMEQRLVDDVSASYERTTAVIRRHI